MIIEESRPVLEYIPVTITLETEEEFVEFYDKLNEIPLEGILYNLWDRLDDIKFDNNYGDNDE